MEIKDLMPLNKAATGTTVTRPLLVTNINDIYKNDKYSHTKITLRDGIGEVTATIFDSSLEKLKNMGIDIYTICDAMVEVSLYNGRRSYLIKTISPTKENITADDFTKLPPIDRDEMFEEMISLLDRVADDFEGKYTPLSELAKKLITDRKDEFIRSSAAVNIHHNHLGGLIYHSYRMTKTAFAICDVYKDLDRELLVSAAAIHDIGKLWEYDTHRFGDADYTATGILFGHAYMGASLIKGGANTNYNPEKVKLLRHLILSHHGALEWGAVTLPAIPEAFALHYIDNLDAKINICEMSYEYMDAGTISPQKPAGLDGRIYKPNYNAMPH